MLTFVSRFGQTKDYAGKNHALAIKLTLSFRLQMFGFRILLLETGIFYLYQALIWKVVSCVMYCAKGVCLRCERLQFQHSVVPQQLVNHKTGITLVMRHIFKWFIHLRAQDLSKGDKNPTYISYVGIMFYLFSKQTE